MSVHQNSIKSYDELQDDGILGEQQRDVLELFNTLGPMTLREAHSFAPNNLELMSVRSRATELQIKGLLEEVRTTRCTTTGKTVAVLQSTLKGLGYGAALARHRAEQHNVNVGTVGHIDHGKHAVWCALLRAQ